MIETATNRKIRLCPLTSVADGGAIGFKLSAADGGSNIFVVRQRGNYYAYVNSCPHTRVSLDWQPGQFLNPGGTLIQCSTHGALFRIEDGLCINGPCVNQSLTSITTELEDGDLCILLQASPGMQDRGA